MTNLEKYAQEMKKLSPELDKIKNEYVKLKEKHDKLFSKLDCNLTIHEYLVGALQILDDDQIGIMLFDKVLNKEDATSIKNWLCNLLNDAPSEYINLR